MGDEGGIAFRETTQVVRKPINPFELGQRYAGNVEALTNVLRRMVGLEPVNVQVTTTGRELLGIATRAPNIHSLLYLDTKRKDLIELAGGENAEQVRKLIAGYIQGDKSGKRTEEVVQALRTALTDIHAKVSGRRTLVEVELKAFREEVARIEDAAANRARKDFPKAISVTDRDFRDMLRYEELREQTNYGALRPDLAKEYAKLEGRMQFLVKTRSFKDVNQLLDSYKKYVNWQLKVEGLTNIKYQEFKNGITSCEAALEILNKAEGRLAANLERLAQVEKPVLAEVSRLLAGVRKAVGKEVRAPVRVNPVLGAAALVAALASAYFMTRDFIKDDEKVPKKVEWGN